MLGNNTKKIRGDGEAMKIYKVIQPADCEGKTSHTIGYFTTRELAEKVFLSNLGNFSMGHSDHSAMKFNIQEIFLYDNIHSFAGSFDAIPTCLLPFIPENERKEVLRASALRKLTDDEKKALGL